MIDIIDAAIATGRYRNRAEYIMAALRFYDDQESTHSTTPPIYSTGRTEIATGGGGGWPTSRWKRRNRRVSGMVPDSSSTIISKDIDNPDNRRLTGFGCKIVKVFSGQYHNKRTIEEHLVLFNALKDVSKNKTLEYLGSGKNKKYGYRIVNPYMGEDFFAADLHKILIKGKKIKSLPNTSENVKDEIVDSAVVGTMRFTMTTDNFIILECTKDIQPGDFEILIDRFIRGWAQSNKIFYSIDNHFSVTLFSYNDNGLIKFMDSANKIVEIEYFIHTLDNPDNSPSAHKLRDSLKGTDADSVKLESKDGLNKESDLIKGMQSYDQDGHVKTRVVTKRGRFKDTYDTRSINNDTDEIECNESIELFAQESKRLLMKIKERIKRD